MLHYHTRAHPHVIFMLTAGANDSKHIAPSVHINVSDLKEMAVCYLAERLQQFFPLGRDCFFSLALRFAGNVWQLAA